MRVRLERLRVVALAMTATLLLVACGGDGGQQAGGGDGQQAGGGGETAEGEPAELRFTWWGSDTRHELTREMIALYEEANPNVSVTAENLGWDGYWERLSTQMAGGNAPDLIQMDYRLLNEYVARDSLLGLNEYVGNGLDLEAWSEDVLGSGRIDEELYAIPLGLNTQSWLISQTALEEAGVEAPDPTTWTWEEYRDLAQQISDNTEEGLWGSADMGGVEPLLEVWLIQRGKSLYTEDGELGFNEQDLAEYWTYWDEMRQSGAVPPADVTASFTGQPVENIALTNEVVAMEYVWSNQYEAVTNVLENLILGFVPQGPQPGQYLKPSMFISASASAEPIDATIDLMDFMLNQEEGVNALGIERGVPGSTEVREILEPQLTEPQAEIVDFLAQLEERAAPTPQAPPPGANAVDELIVLLYQEISFEQFTVDEAVDQFFTEAPGLIGL